MNVQLGTEDLLLWMLQRDHRAHWRFEEDGSCPAVWWEPRTWLAARTFTALSFPG